MSDLIKRETVLAFVRRCKDRLKGKGLTYEILVDYIESIPSAERKGRNLLAEYPSLFECSECGTSCYDTIPWDCNINYCPNCGCRMKGAEDE